ncbi:helix-turn-helix transcriptional regulator [Acidovorax sp.]|uniref:helix-turn-helix domain-containing protein n=1 Tax=Acidovorax sp. TaxID=1872122 RepID=UPI002ACD6169|nr:helix-turn-helix transcriptional regulator [Acidovorax sp.]MDZ7862999.1 helix-turn-helix transcriptional regulator [Acidovorax sp.]
MADARLKRPVDPETAAARREELYRTVASGEISLGDAVARMRKISRLTQEEFAAHRGISVQALRQIERDQGNPTVETLNKVAEVFSLQVGFVPLRRR